MPFASVRDPAAGPEGYVVTTTPPAALSAPEQVVRLVDGEIVTTTAISADEPCFAGHYPGFPLLPGVLLIEIVRRAAVRYAAERHGRTVRLRTLTTARFSAPVRPGDVVTTECRFTWTAGVLEASAACRSGSRRVASIRASYVSVAGEGE